MTSRRPRAISFRRRGLLAGLLALLAAWTVRAALGGYKAEAVEFKAGAE